MIKPTDPNLVEEASRWVLKMRENAGSATERRAFQAWLAADPRHLPAYRHAESVWNSFDASEPTAGEPLLANARCQFREARKQNQRSRHARLRRSALVVLLAVSAPLAWQWLNSAEYRTGKGQRLAITLSDGSQIELNTDTRLLVNYAWQTRQIILERGEAQFTVAHDPQKPFEVVAAAGKIRDIGTRFNVCHWQGRIAVSVLEGEVDVSTASSTHSERLAAGNQISYDPRGTMARQTVFDAAAVTAWRKDLLVFDKVSLTDVLAQLSRYHDVELKLADPTLGAMKVSGDFPSKDLAAALAVIAAALPVKVAPESSGAIVLKR
ncbi:FecR family protein [Methylomonas koyamae]|uniref:Iron dicitrate transport regulator FecR n=1 Tax=Methylomonas koyamae TaxID=702114 RepID=A0AA91DGE4_9GAMM|nr:FecR family protein [Methylomonas koyamae]OAI30288.1 hypothetical protein A1356_21650 [Methylomonas koyamae]